MPTELNASTSSWPTGDMPPLVSVVIPNYNRDEELRRAIKSVFGQTYSHFEIIIVDDGSSIDVASLIAEFHDERIRLIQLPGRSGAAVARNRGIAEANGLYIAFLDSDDEWFSEKLAAQVEAARGFGDTKDFLAAHALEIVDGGPRRENPTRAPRTQEPIGEYLFVSGQNLQTSSLFGPTRLFRKLGFRPELKRHQDWDLILRIAFAGVPLLYTNKALARYINVNASNRISRNDDPAFSAAWIKNLAGATGSTRAAFMIRVVMPQLVNLDRRGEAFSLLVKNWRAAKFPLTSLARLSAKAFFPSTYTASIRTATRTKNLFSSRRVEA